LRGLLGRFLVRPNQVVADYLGVRLAHDWSTVIQPVGIPGAVEPGRNNVSAMSPRPHLSLNRPRASLSTSAWSRRRVGCHAISLVEQAHIRLLLVPAVTDEARSFYKHFDDEASDSLVF
jgi:hypothetical protein